MAKSNRDDFPPVIIRKLKERYNLLCCNPECRATTSCPHQHDEEKSVCIGKAAHICAAAPGGPRYDESMTREQRRGINNAIWLCGPCADKIDKDENAYKKELLYQWKIDAANSLIGGLGKKLPNTTDAVDTMMMALTGAPKSVIFDAIPNILSATTQSLEKLDPRFHIKASHQENLTSFTMLAKENVSCKMHVAEDYKEEFNRKYTNLIKHGETLEIDTQAVRLEGSSLFEFMNTGLGKFTLSNSVRKGAVQKIWLLPHGSQETFHIDDIHGEIGSGEESFNFLGYAYGGLLELKYTCPLEPEESGKFTFTLSVDYKKWDSYSLTALPYFEKLKRLFSILATGCKLSTALEIDGIEIFKASIPDHTDTRSFANFQIYCDYIDLAVAIFNRFNRTVLHNSNFKYSRQTHEFLFLINKTLHGESVGSNAYDATLSCTFVAEDDLENVKLITKSSEPQALRLEQDFGPALELFGEKLQLPRSYFVVTSVVPRVKQPIKSIRPGDEFDVEWVSQDDCQVVTGFLDYSL